MFGLQHLHMTSSASSRTRAPCSMLLTSGVFGILASLVLGLLFLACVRILSFTIQIKVTWVCFAFAGESL